MTDWVDHARRWVPRGVRNAIQRKVSLSALKLRERERANPLADVRSSDENSAGSPVVFGIVQNAAQYHRHFVAACLEEGVPFRVLDLSGPDWLEVAEDSDCEVLLVWPDAFLSVWNRMIKDRVQLLEHNLGFATVPSSREMWMYEDKRRTAYWLGANRIPHPTTWVFYRESEAQAFAGSCPLPIVFKTSFGASGSGVRILKTRRRVRAVVRRAFDKGIVAGGAERRDRQWGSILFQQYIPGVKEWRIVRIGDWFFSRRKGHRGDYYRTSSGWVGWARPPYEVLSFAREVTETGCFRSMSVDLFETVDGHLLVNELQAVFGAPSDRNLEKGIEHCGRWCFDEATQDWSFEPGDFYRNACANARVRDALDRGLRRGRSVVDGGYAVSAPTGEGSSS